ncbi:MAG: hypothetical protein R3F35_18590 [Myxococcota bacterium]
MFRSRAFGHRILIALLLVQIARPTPTGATEPSPPSGRSPAADSSIPVESPPAPPPASPDAPASRAESVAPLDDRIAALRAERDATRLTGPIVGTTLGALVLWAGLQTVYTAQVSCRGIGLSGGYDCSDDTIWGLTAGGGAAIAAGAIAVALIGPKLSKRLARRRALTHAIRRLELEREASGALRHPRPELRFGLAITRERQALQAVVRF